VKLDPIPIPAWPKLAWAARLRPGVNTVEVYHGPCVEADRQRCVEAVWAGDYGQADFDRTDLVFGTGLRCREEKVVLVSSGTTLDRLWYHRGPGGWHVANSLTALLAVTGVSLVETYADYARDVDTIRHGLTGYRRRFPCSDGELRVLYFQNLLWDGHCFEEIEKPDTAPQFDAFETYAAYLYEAGERLAANMNGRGRTHTVTPLATVSQGYDSSVAAVVARRAGCREAVTISQSTSLWRGSDSGEEVAKHLGLNCTAYDRTARRYPEEETIWSVAGRASILSWTLFDYPQPLSLFFTGVYGDKMWSRQRWKLPDPFAWASLSVGGIGEFRLVRGVFHCPVPFWGIRHVHELHDISFSEVMQPWSINSDYDRPVARRLVEEAGVPRTAFGQCKKNTSHDAALLWPYTPVVAASFRRFLASRGLPAPGPHGIWLRRRAATLTHLAHTNVLERFTRSVRRRRTEATYADANLLFQWANHNLKERYETAMKGNERTVP